MAGAASAVPAPLAPTTSTPTATSAAGTTPSSAQVAAVAGTGVVALVAGASVVAGASAVAGVVVRTVTVGAASVAGEEAVASVGVVGVGVTVGEEGPGAVEASEAGTVAEGGAGEGVVEGSGVGAVVEAVAAAVAASCRNWASLLGRYQLVQCVFSHHNHHPPPIEASPASPMWACLSVRGLSPVRVAYFCVLSLCGAVPVVCVGVVTKEIPCASVSAPNKLHVFRCQQPVPFAPSPTQSRPLACWLA